MRREANIALDADHERAGELLVAPGLAAADQTADRVLAQKFAKEVAARE